jgi:hypothetical protein
MVVYWTHAIEFWLSQNVIVSCSHHVVLYCTKNYKTNVVYFSKTYYHTSFQDYTLGGTSVAPISQDHASTMLVLLTAGNKVRVYGNLWHNVHTNFHQNLHT